AGGPVSGQTGGAAEAAGADVEVVAGLPAVVLCEHPDSTRAVAPATAAKRIPRARKDLLFMGTFPSGWTSCPRRLSFADRHAGCRARVRLRPRDHPPAQGTPAAYLSE